MRFKLLALVLSTTLSLAAAEMMLGRQRASIEGSDRQDPGLIRYDRILGWRLSAGWSGKHRHHDFEAEYHINHQGFRGERGESASQRRTIGVLGDSFTFGLGVDDDETFAHRLEQASGGADVVLNLGVPGYSTDQEVLFLRHRLPDLGCDVVVLVVYLGNDLFDNALAFPLQGERAKPRFELESAALRLATETVPRSSKPAAARGRTLASLVLGEDAPTPSPLQAWLWRSEILRRMGWLQPRYPSSDEAFRERFRAALDLFYALVREAASEALRQRAELRVVLLPGRSFVAEPETISARYQDYLRRRIVTDGVGASTPVIDVAARLRDEYPDRDGRWFFPNDGHLTPLGHAVVAEILTAELGVR